MTQKVLPRYIIVGFFLIGIISATLFRSMVIVNRYFPGYSRAVWYCAVIGYIFFFGYRFHIASKRRKAVLDGDLIRKVNDSGLAENDRRNVSYILNSLVQSREMYNYIFIFALSLVAIAADIVLEIVN
ncbi:MAG: hypothetical protein ACOC2H_00410 [Spirochaetota bacterium]